MRFELETAAEANDELLDAFKRLIPQLTKNAPPPSLTGLTALIQSDSTSLIIARAADDSSIVGALSLTVYRVPTGIRSIIEDVIVDQSARGQGLGEALMQRAIEIARERGASNIALTSNPMCDAANRLYVRMGFKKRETNAYIYILTLRRKSILHIMSFDFAPRLALVSPLRTKFALSGERVLSPLEVETMARKVSYIL